MKFRLSVFVLVLFAGNYVSASPVTGKVSGASGVSVVYVNAVPGKSFPLSSAVVQINQRGLQFIPHILAVPTGTTLEFLNSDNVSHNVFWPSTPASGKKSINLGSWSNGEKKSYKFNQAGLVELLCQIHPEMSAYVVVSPTPYYALTDESGSFTLDVPDGSYTISAWNEKSKVQSKTVKVDGNTKVDFFLSK